MVHRAIARLDRCVEKTGLHVENETLGRLAQSLAWIGAVKETKLQVGRGAIGLQVETETLVRPAQSLAWIGVARAQRYREWE